MRWCMPWNFNRFTIHNSMEANSLQISASSSTGFIICIVQTALMRIWIVFRLIGWNEFYQMSDSKIFSIDPSEPIPDPIASTKTTQAKLRFVEQKSSPLNSETVYYSLFESTNQSFACETSCDVCIFPPKS